MFKAPLARLFPGLFPRGSSDSDITCPSISTFCRPGRSSASPNAPSHSYDNWGRLESKRQIDMVSDSFARILHLLVAVDESKDTKWELWALISLPLAPLIHHVMLETSYEAAC